MELASFTRLSPNTTLYSSVGASTSGRITMRDPYSTVPAYLHTYFINSFLAYLLGYLLTHFITYFLTYFLPTGAVASLSAVLIELLTSRQAHERLDVLLTSSPGGSHRESSLLVPWKMESVATGSMADISEPNMRDSSSGDSETMCVMYPCLYRRYVSRP